MRQDVEDRVIALIIIIVSVGFIGFWFFIIALSTKGLMDGYPLEYGAFPMAILMVPFVLFAGHLVWRAILVWRSTNKQKPK